LPIIHSYIPSRPVSHLQVTVQRIYPIITDDFEQITPVPNQKLHEISTLTPASLALMQAVALLYIYFFKPLMALIHKSKHILDLNPTFLSLRGLLKALGEDPTPLMKGECTLFAGFEERDGLLLRRALEPSPHDEGVKEYLQYGTNALLVTLERVKEQFLPEGEFENGTDERLRERTASVPTTNRKNEATFGRLDNLGRDMHRLKSINVAGQIKAKQNGTAEWLDKLENKKAIVEAATKASKILQRNELEWERQGLQKAEEERLHKLAQCEARDEAAQERKQKLRESLETEGLPWKEEEIPARIAAIAQDVLASLEGGRSSAETKAKKVEAGVVSAVWRQIEIRLVLFGEKGKEKMDIQKSSKEDKKFDSKRLIENLKRIMSCGRRPEAAAPARGPVERSSEEREALQRRDLQRFKELQVPLVERRRLQEEKEEKEKAAREEATKKKAADRIAKEQREKAAKAEAAKKKAAKRD
jgi:hypothetical protein